MWPRRGGPVGPRTSVSPEEDFELLPSQSSASYDEIRAANALTHSLTSLDGTQRGSTSSLSTSSVLESYIFSLSPPYPCPLQMPIEPRNAPGRTYQRMFRRMQHPYRLLTLSERMHIYRPTLPSQLEEESTEQRSDIEVQVRPTRASKRQTRICSPYNQRNQIPEHYAESNQPSDQPDLQVIPPDHRIRRTRPTQLQETDEPDIIITSDVQLQTDDEETGYNSGSLLSGQRQSSPAEFPIQYDSASASTAEEATPHSAGANDLPEFASGYSDIEMNERYSYLANSDVTQTAVENQSNVSEVKQVAGASADDLVIANPSALNKSLQDLSSGVPFKLFSRSASMPFLPVPTFKACQVANNMIKHARNNKTLNDKGLHCLDCDLFPVQPVTGLCGHTRCTKCIEKNGNCPCGAEAPKDLHVNTVVQYLTRKMLPNHDSGRLCAIREHRPDLCNEKVSISPAVVKTDSLAEGSARRTGRLSRASRFASLRARSHGADVNARMPMSPQVRFEYARRLLAAGRHRDAASHLARVAASSESLARRARIMLSKVITLVSKGSDPRRMARDLLRSVRTQSAASWLKPGDLECVLCYHTYTKPVTTPCGHTYCRTCIERALDYRKACALCLRPLEGFDVMHARETAFVAAALESIDASQPPQPLDPNVIPVFVCTVAYPSIPCPLFIFDPRYWLMIRRVLESGSRKFGMVAYERDRSNSDYGTVLEVCDCVHLEDGRSFLSTVGVSRFKVVERGVRDGCDVARIQPLVDITPTEGVVILNLRMLSSQILYKALMWLNSMNKNVRAEIEAAFGQIPRIEHESDAWWNSADGPAWLWWLVAILPLRSEIKVLILSTKNLLKRMMAVSRTLEAIDQVAITTTATSECEIRSALTNAEEWLERGS